LGEASCSGSLNSEPARVDRSSLGEILRMRRKYDRQARPWLLWAERIRYVGFTSTLARLGWQILAQGLGAQKHFAHDFMFRLAAVEFGALTAQNLAREFIGATTRIYWGQALQSHIVVMQDSTVLIFTDLILIKGYFLL
jgi:hypothetical protein